MNTHFFPSGQTCNCDVCRLGLHQIQTGELAFAQASDEQKEKYVEALEDTFCTALALNFFDLHAGAMKDTNQNGSDDTSRTARETAGINLWRNLSYKSVEVHFCPCNTQNFVEVLYGALRVIVRQGGLWKADLPDCHGEVVHIRRKGKVVKVILHRVGEVKTPIRFNY